MDEHEVRRNRQLAFEYARTAIACVRCAHDGDDLGLQSLIIGSDPLLLCEMLSRLGADLLEQGSPDPSETLRLLAEFVLERAPE
jgi:hypothetical protein